MAVPTDPLQNFGFLLKDVSRLYSCNFERHSQSLGLTLAHCKVLGYLQRNEGVSQARLAFLTDTDPMTLARLLDRMAAEGLLERRPDPNDRRAHCLHLLPPALPVLEEIWRLSAVARTEAFAGLNAADRALLLQLMQRVHANLDALMPGTADRSGVGTKPAGKPAPRRAGSPSQAA